MFVDLHKSYLSLWTLLNNGWKRRVRVDVGLQVPSDTGSKREARRLVSVRRQGG
jgi:hypothetical protein